MATDPTTGQPVSQYTSGNSLTQSGSSGSAQNQFATDNQYTAQQQALQNQQGQTLAGLLAGSSSVPANFGYSPEVMKVALDQFNREEMPKLAAQYGAGSPVIGGQLSNLLAQLAAGSSQQGWTNFQNVLGDAQNAAYTPVGTAGGSSQSQNQNTSIYNSQQQNTTPGGALTSTLANSAGALLSGAGNLPNLPNINIPGGRAPATPTLP